MVRPFMEVARSHGGLGLQLHGSIGQHKESLFLPGHARFGKLYGVDHEGLQVEGERELRWVNF
jgi:hypothetical protein